MGEGLVVEEGLEHVEGGGGLVGRGFVASALESGQGEGVVDLDVASDLGVEAPGTPSLDDRTVQVFETAEGQRERNRCNLHQKKKQKKAKKQVRE